MRILPWSDTHMEIYPERLEALVETLYRLDAQDRLPDVLVLAGDICGYKHFDAQVGPLCDLVRHVVMVMGNHDNWASTLPKALTAGKEFQAKHSNFHLLEKERVEIDGIGFVGCTLWYKMTPTAMMLKKGWPDFRRIDEFDPDNEARWSEHFLRQEIKPGDVVVTHYAPSEKSIDPDYMGDVTNCFFVNNQERTMDSKGPALWIHGHVHHSFDYEVSETRVVCNPMGYGENENMSWDPEKIVEVRAPIIREPIIPSKKEELEILATMDQTPIEHQFLIPAAKKENDK